MNKPFIYIGLLFLSLSIVAIILESTQNTKDTSKTTTISFSEFDQIIQTPINKITPVELANALIKQTHHYNLFDLRLGEVDYRIPTAEIASANQIIAKNIPVNEVIWLYAENESEALQVYYLLLIRGYFKVRVVTSGMLGWKQDILVPNVEFIPASEQIHRKAISEFFGGSFSKQAVKFTPKPVAITKKHKKHHGC